MEKKKGFQMPHTYIIIFGVILFAALLTVFIPLGKYDTKEITYMQNGVEKTRTVLDPESFQYILDENGNKVTKAAPIFGTEDFGGQGILNYVFEGMTVGDKNGTAVGIIAFILVVGGAFGIVLRTGAIESGIMRVIALTNGREILLIPILVVLFSLGGAVFGMGEEAIPFVMILVPMFIAMGMTQLSELCAPTYLHRSASVLPGRIRSDWLLPRVLPVFRSCPVHGSVSRYGSSSQDLRSSSQCATQ